MCCVLFTHDACLAHDTGPQHVENSHRLEVITDALEQDEFKDIIRATAPFATRDELIRVHGAGYVDNLIQLRPEPGERIMIDADTVVSHRTMEAALAAAGASVGAVDAVMSGAAHTAFVAVRPPGHHAGRSTSMGYCFFNNLAVAAEHARLKWKIERIAIADFDAHHGNGTQSIYENSTAVFYSSSHQYPCFPGTGLSSEHGNANNVVNVPLLPHSNGAHFRSAWKNVILPAMDSFAPELILVSAGFDAHFRDPTAQLAITSDDYGWITRQLIKIARKYANDRIVSILEGGYDPSALAESVSTHVKCLMSHGPASKAAYRHTTKL